MANDFEEGVLVGLLVGEGHFGGDGRQPQVTLRMHERHAALFRWIERTYPGGRLYGPYEHGGRRYYQWMARGAYLREELAPLLQHTLSPSLDGYAYARFTAMCERYGSQLGLPGQAARREPEGGRPPDDRRGEAHGGPVVGLPGPAPGNRASRIFDALRRADTNRGAGA